MKARFFFLLVFISPLFGHQIALNWKPEPEFGGFYAAELIGAYKKAGLAIELLPGGSSAPTVQMVAAGTVPFGITSGEEIVTSRARGSDVVALFTVYQTSPMGVMTHDQPGIRSIKDVFKKEGTLAINKGRPMTLFLERAFGFSKLKVVPYTGGVSQFLLDPKFVQQCYVTAEPILARHQGAKVRVFPTSEIGYNPYNSVLIARSSFVKENRALVDKVIAAVREGWHAYLKNPAEANAIMGKLNPSMDAATFSEGAAAQKKLIETAETKKHGLGFMTAARWETLAKQLSEFPELQVAGKTTSGKDYFYSSETLSK